MIIKVNVEVVRPDSEDAERIAEWYAALVRGAFGDAEGVTVSAEVL